MKLFLTGLLGALLISSAYADSTVSFSSVDIYLDSADPVAAWQLEFAATSGVMKVVGVENGESDVFGDAPYYDREAVDQGRADRIIVADYSLAVESALPRGRFRVATLHLMLSENDTPEFGTRLIVTATHDGSRTDATISLEFSAGSEK